MRSPLRNRRVRIAVLLLVAVLALAALMGPRLVQRYHARAFTPVMQRYIAAAVAGDSAALETLSAGHEPVRWALGMRRREPALLELAARGMQPEMLGSMGSGLERLRFRFRHPFAAPGCAYPYDGIYAAFRTSGGSWRLVQAGIGPC